MHIKLDTDGRVVFGTNLIKTSQDLNQIANLSSRQLEGDGLTKTAVCCYDDSEVTEVMSILQANSIDGEIAPLTWDQAILDAVGTDPYTDIQDAVKKLVIVTVPETAETKVTITIGITLPPEPMVTSISCSYKATDHLTGYSFASLESIPYTSSKFSVDHIFNISADYLIEVSTSNSLYGTANITVDPMSKLTGVKQAHLKELDTTCNQAILKGFKSWALGSGYTYDFDYEAQINFAGMMNSINGGITTGNVIWKTKEGGPLSHTIPQFKMLFTDGMLFKQQTIAKYWILKQKVLACTTEEDVYKIQW